MGIARRPTEFPYIPGLLTYREIPSVLDALNKIKQTPDLLLCDGQGIAIHLGIICDLPSIGVGKSRLIGRHRSVPENKGEWTALLDHGETIGALLRTRPGVKPLHVSSGHKICLESAIKYVMACITRYKLPETTRWAHRLASGPAF